MKAALKKVFPGVSWQNPVLTKLFRLIDPADYLIRSVRGLSHLPPYSIRVRSNGVTKQFGGLIFHRFGHQLADHLVTNAFLNNHSRVLEIGCGCGRTAFALAEILDDEKFVGMDINKISLESCIRTPLFIRKKFRFDLMDIQNDEYNREGKYHANTYKFPYKSGEFDVIFLVSVFTHMLTDDVKNYISEISRMLTTGGVCMITTFLMDQGRQWPGISFPYHEKEHYFHNTTLPEIAIGYDLGFFERNFEQHGLRLTREPLLGDWRKDQAVLPTSGFGQDIIFFAKEE
jgi:SAM-dependent methyltransferase